MGMDHFSNQTKDEFMNPQFQGRRCVYDAGVLNDIIREVMYHYDRDRDGMLTYTDFAAITTSAEISTIMTLNMF